VNPHARPYNGIVGRGKWGGREDGSGGAVFGANRRLKRRTPPYLRHNLPTARGARSVHEWRPYPPECPVRLYNLFNRGSFQAFIGALQATRRQEQCPPRAALSPSTPRLPRRDGRVPEGLLSPLQGSCRGDGGLGGRQGRRSRRGRRGEGGPDLPPPRRGQRPLGESVPVPRRVDPEEPAVVLLHLCQ